MAAGRRLAVLPQRAAGHRAAPAGGVAAGARVAALVAFGIGYVLLFQWARKLRQFLLPVPAGRARAGLALLLAVGLASLPGTGGDWLATLVYVAAAAVFLLPPWESLAVVVVCAVTRCWRPGWCPGGRRRTASSSRCCSPRSPCSGCRGWPSATANSGPRSRNRSARGRRGERAPPATCMTSSAIR
ncbi:hypothetical protein NKG94_45870 [Micromonospora sp. M12]